jgi:hypothetical protein
MQRLAMLRQVETFALFVGTDAELAHAADDLQRDPRPDGAPDDGPGAGCQMRRDNGKDSAAKIIVKTL